MSLALLYIKIQVLECFVEVIGTEHELPSWLNVFIWLVYLVCFCLEPVNTILHVLLLTADLIL